MAFPRANHSSDSIVAYAMEVAGRLSGIASTDIVLSDPAKQKALNDIAASIENPALALFTLNSNQRLAKLTTYRKQMGVGRGIDHAFGRHVQNVSESIRTGPAHGSRDHAEYLKVFKDGNTKAFVDPTIREDPQLCDELLRCLQLVGDLPSKATLLDATAKIQNAIGPAASALIQMEEQQSKDFTLEVEARQAVVDALWVGKKMAEVSLGRDKGLLSFIFFDFDKSEAGGKPQGGEGGGGKAPQETGGAGQATG